MTDRELLEAAAKADGEYHGEWSGRAGAFRIRYAGEWREWNPLTDDGDALRLAVRLGLYDLDELMVANAHDPAVDVQADPYAATRRAIVRAAAEIGRSKE